MRLLRSIVPGVVAVLLFAPSVLAQKNQTPVIAAANFDDTTLFIQGTGFDQSPTVTLGGFILGGVIVNGLGTQIQVAMPDMQPGAYQLVVSNGNNKTTAFELTVGVQGPAGPAGADGADGAPGPPGADGPQGPEGPVGPQGPQGLTGATGATGETGPDGPQGPSGVLGRSCISGSVGTPVLDQTSGYSFVGPTASVTTSGVQRLTGAATAELGTSEFVSFSLAIGLCYQVSPEVSSPVNFVGDNHVVAPFTYRFEQQLSASASVVVPAGTYRVGLCARLVGGPMAILNTSGNVNGWVIVSQ